jgi:hypothetical protein
MFLQRIKFIFFSGLLYFIGGDRSIQSWIGWLLRLGSRVTGPLNPVFEMLRAIAQR